MKIPVLEHFQTQIHFRQWRDIGGCKPSGNTSQTIKTNRQLDADRFSMSHYQSPPARNKSSLLSWRHRHKYTSCYKCCENGVISLVLHWAALDAWDFSFHFDVISPSLHGPPRPVCKICLWSYSLPVWHRTQRCWERKQKTQLWRPVDPQNLLPRTENSCFMGWSFPHSWGQGIHLCDLGEREREKETELTERETHTHRERGMQTLIES